MKFFDHKLPRYPMTSISDYRQMAKKKLPKQLFEFLDGGAFDEVTIRKNSSDYEKIELKRRVLQDISTLDLRTEIFNHQLDFPLILAPVGYAGVYGCRGEVQAARAASKSQIPFSLSTVSICSIEEVASSSSVPFWFQFYLFKEKSHSLDLLKRVEAAHCPTLLLTVDLPIAGARHRYNRTRRKSSFINSIDSVLHFDWWVNVKLRGQPLTAGNIPVNAPKLSNLAEMRKWMGSQFCQSFTWKDVEWLRSHWRGNLVIKGILEPEDALIASKIGADGIVVSNHGGRHLDGTSSTITALPAICNAVKGSLKIFIDGGIASGVDIAKALAVGADACMIGRPWVYGLAARGEEGVSEVISLLKSELKIVMSHLGVNKIEDLKNSLRVIP